MRNYLNQHENHISCELKIDHLLHISRGLLHIHNSDIIHRDLHSGNILFDGTPYISGLGSCQPVNYKGQIIVYGILPYVAPEVLRRYEYTKAADIYSFGIVMNEFMSEETPYNDDSNDQIYLTVNICKGSRPKISEYTPKLLANLVTKCWDSDPDERPTIQEVVTTLKAMTLKNLSSKQQIIQQFKLNYGLFLDGYSIKPSEQAVLSEDGDLDISLYEGQPLVYTFVNDRDSHINLLSFNSGDNSIEFNEGLQSSDISINFPVAEITYSTDDLLVNFMESETYGHLFAKKILVGGKLFISDLISATSTQTDSFKFFLTWVYDSAKYSKENPFNNLIGSNFLAKIRTLDGKDLNTCGKLTNWMNNLYQNDVIDIISYNNLIPISKLRSIASSLLDEIDEKQPGVANFREKLSFYEWIGNSSYTNLTKWINEKHLIYGLIINKHFELEISKKIAINFINIPSVDSSTKFYLKIINPT
ncbi:kinase-like protein, partial [Rhizophagus irregularis]